MTGRWYRPLLAVAALSMALAGGLSVLFSHTADVQAAQKLFTVEVLDSGFNPKLCQLSRFDSVRFYNKSSKAAHIVQPDAGSSTNPPLVDLGLIAPGETSGSVIKSAGGELYYVDLETPSHTFTLSSPSNTEAGPENCSPLPPTPTPTPTFTPGPSKTPTPIATATPTATPTPRLPLYCKAQALGAVLGQEGCAVAPGIARDNE